MFKRYSIIIFAFLITSVSKAQNLPDSMLAFFSQNKKTTSFLVIRNDTLQVSWNSKQSMNTAGMSNLLVAFEFAKQAAYKVIDTAERVPLKELAKYYLPGNRNDQYSEWLNTMMMFKKADSLNRVPLLEVARGMLQFGSMALSEYLMDRLGFDNIKSNIQSLGLSGHTSIVPPSASLSLFQNRANTNPKKIKKEIDKMDEEEYCKSAFLMHLAMKNDSLFKIKFGNLAVTKDFIHTWSDRLPKSTTLAYGQFLQMMVKEKAFEKPIFNNLRRVVEWPMQYPTVTKMFNRFSMTGSATPFVFTQAQYGITTNNDTIIAIYICEDLKPEDYSALSRWHQQFEMNIFTQPAFLNKVAVTLK